MSIEEGHWKTARELLNCPDEESLSALVLIPDDNGQSPLHVLCKGTGDYRTMHVLLGLHGDVQAHDKNRRVRFVPSPPPPPVSHLPPVDPAALRLPLRVVPHGLPAAAGGRVGVYA